MAKKLIVLASGSGSNFEAIAEACKNGSINADIVALLCNRPGAKVVDRAQAYGIPTIEIDHKQYPDRLSFDQAMIDAMEPFQADGIILAGFMRILSEEFVEHFLGRMLNIHPSLLPKYPGINTHEKAIQACDKEHGATVHFVTPELDGGPIVAQCKVPVMNDDTPSSLAARLLVSEHQLYPEVLRWFVDDRLQYSDQGVKLDAQKLPSQGRLLSF